jgi:hypothetical protein
MTFANPILYLFLIISAISCVVRKIPSPPDLDHETDKNCVREVILSRDERLQIYPFNVAKEIKLVSYDDKMQPDSTYISLDNRIPKENGRVAFGKMDEVVLLNQQDIEQLTDILYNYKYKERPITFPSSGCFDPRNAIVFVDKHEKAYEYLEICFQCGGYEKSSKQVNEGDFCIGKYDLLKNFFISKGITIGTVRGIFLDKKARSDEEE